MGKIECQNCGRKAVVGQDERRSDSPMRYCRRCGEELQSRAER